MLKLIRWKFLISQKLDQSLVMTVDWQVAAYHKGELKEKGRIISQVEAKNYTNYTVNAFHTKVRHLESYRAHEMT